MTRQLLRAAFYTVAGVIKGKRLLWDAVDDFTAWLGGLGDWADPGEDDKPDRCPAYVPEALVSDR